MLKFHGCMTGWRAARPLLLDLWRFMMRGIVEPRPGWWACTIWTIPLEPHLNADFDLSLRPRWRPPVGETAQHRITDLAWHAVFLAERGDSVLEPEPAPTDRLL